jgi:CheY-like chemotaxis protein
MKQFSSTILLVEDNEDDIFVMRRAMRLGNFSNPLQIVTDGQQAVDYLSGARQYGNRERYPLPFIIFLDLKNPYLDGFEILTWIRQQRELDSVVVVVLTSSAETRDQEQAYTLGARSYLVKPPTPQALNSVFESLKSYWLSKSDSLPVSLGNEPLVSRALPPEA